MKIISEMNANSSMYRLFMSEGTEVKDEKKIGRARIFDVCPAVVHHRNIQ